MVHDDPARREQLIGQVLAAEDPRACARRLALDHGLPPAAVWQWSIEHARKRAAEIVHPDEVEAVLRDQVRWNALREQVERDRTLAVANRLHELLRTMSVEPDTIRAAFAWLPVDGSHDHHLEVLLFSETCPVDLLEDFIAQGRSITAIAHRNGPRQILERVRAVYPFDEPVLTLLRWHYMPAEQPLDALLRFVDEVGPQFADAIEHNLRHWTELPSSRHAALRERLRALRLDGVDGEAASSQR